MQKKLGELLLARGLITESDLHEALQHQPVYGSRIGTILVQMSRLRLDDLARALSTQHGVPLADSAALGAVNADILSRVPADLCAKHLVIPFGEQRGSVMLAMRDPLRQVAGQVSFAIGQPVLRYVLPELRIMYCLERYCGIPRDPRYLRTPPAGAAADPDSFAAVAEEGTAERRRYLQSTVTPQADTASVPQGPPSAEDPQLLALDQYTVPEVSADAIDLDFEAADTPHEPVYTPRPIDLAVAALDVASSGSAVAEQLVQPLTGNTIASVLFWIRGDHAVACHASGVSVSPADLRQVVVPLSVNSMLSFSYTLRGTVRGDATCDAVHTELTQALGIPPVGQACVTSVLLNGKVANLICHYTARGEVFDESLLEDLRRLSERATIAYLRIARQLKGP